MLLSPSKQHKEVKNMSVFFICMLGSKKRRKKKMFKVSLQIIYVITRMVFKAYEEPPTGITLRKEFKFQDPYLFTFSWKSVS